MKDAWTATKNTLVLLLAGVGLLSGLTTLVGAKSKLSTNLVDNSIQIKEPKAQGRARVQVAQETLDSKDPIFEVRIEIDPKAVDMPQTSLAKPLVFEGFLLADTNPQWHYRDYFSAISQEQDRYQLWVQCLKECERLVAVLYDMNRPLDEQLGTAFYFFADESGRMRSRNMDLSYWITTDDPMTLERAVQLLPNLKDASIL